MFYYYLSRKKLEAHFGVFFYIYIYFFKKKIKKKKRKLVSR